VVSSQDLRGLPPRLQRQYGLSRDNDFIRSLDRCEVGHFFAVLPATPIFVIRDWFQGSRSGGAPQSASEARTRGDPLGNQHRD